MIPENPVPEEEKREFCHAKDADGRKREQHKSSPGVYDGQAITTCVWCGATLESKEG